MAQDRAGFLWIATGNGLVRFDGYQFRAQERTSADPATRNLGWIRSLLAGRDGRLWIGTDSDGLAVYDPVSENVTTYGRDAQAAGGASSRVMPTIRAMAEDGDGDIWVGSESGGLDRFDPKGERFSHYQHASQPGSLPDNRVRALLIDQQKTLWVGTWAGLSRRQVGSDRFEPVFSGCKGSPGLAGHLVQALFEASDGRLWVGTQEGDLAIIDPATSKGLLLEHALGGLSQGAVSSFVEAPGGRIWVGRSSGIEPYDIKSGRLLQRLQHDLTKPAGLAGNEVTTLLRDHAGLIWVGGLGVGLQRTDPNNRSIWLRGPDRETNGPFFAGDVRSLLQVDNGEIWAATHYTGVMVMDQQLRTTHLRVRQMQLQHLVRERTSALEESCLTDPLTGLRNRRFLAQHIEADVALAVRAYESHLQYGADLRDDADLIFFLFDIDHFKRVNDELGHAAGDAVIMQMRARLLRVFRDSDYPVRWGGEEFLVVARATARVHAPGLAERARVASSEQPFELGDGRLLSKTCSTGFCCFPLSAQHASTLDWSAMVRIADAALYAVKNAGRNGWLGALSARAESPAALLAAAQHSRWLTGHARVICKWLAQ